MDIIQQLRGSHWADASERLRLVNLAADEIERLRSQMVLFDPSTTQEMAAAALNFANDELKLLQERNHVLRKALQLIADPLRGPDVTHYLVVASYQGIARKALGEK